MSVSGPDTGMSAITSPVIVVAVVTVVLVVLAAVAVMLAVQRRHRRRVDVLLGRLAEIEHRSADRDRQATESSVGEQLQAKGPDHAEEQLKALMGNDPLAGRTSHVRRVVNGTDQTIDALADQAISCIHRHLGEAFTAGMMAEELYVSIRTLERGIATALECTPSQLITAMKMREARRLLASGSYRVNEVAAQLAFSTPQYFSRRFKSFYGLSPSRFLNEK